WRAARARRAPRPDRGRSPDRRATSRRSCPRLLSKDSTKERLVDVLSDGIGEPIVFGVPRGNERRTARVHEPLATAQPFDEPLPQRRVLEETVDHRSDDRATRGDGSVLDAARPAIAGGDFEAGRG